MKITWHKTTSPDRYKYILRDYYLELKLDSGESLILLNVSIEHPHNWDNKLESWVTDFSLKVIRVHKLTFEYNDEGKTLALRYVKAFLQAFSTEVSMNTETAIQNPPTLEI